MMCEFTSVDRHNIKRSCWVIPEIANLMANFVSAHTKETTEGGMPMKRQVFGHPTVTLPHTKRSLGSQANM